MCAKKEMMIAMDPDMAAAFNASTHVSRKFYHQSIQMSGLLYSTLKTLIKLMDLLWWRIISSQLKTLVYGLIDQLD